MNVVMLGRPGSGKGTQSERIEATRGLRHLSTGELLRDAKRQDTPLGRQIAERIDAGNFVSDELAMSLVEQALQEHAEPGYVFDGIPRTVRQAELLASLLARRDEDVDLAILLDVSEQLARQRLLERGRQHGRDDDAADTITHRLAVYEAETAPLADAYRRSGLLRTIDGSGTPEQVHQRIEQVLDDVLDAPR